MTGLQLNLTRGIAAAAALAAALPGAAQAATASTTLSVTATVTSNCTVSTTPVAFGSIDVIAGTNADATGGVTVTCTNGTGWSAAAGVGGGAGATFASRKMTAGANLLNYTLYTDAARTSVWGDGSGTTATVSNTGSGAAQAFTVYGRVPLGQTTVPAGGYSDTVAVTITY
jgi:spore coat protein U-like protein